MRSGRKHSRSGALHEHAPLIWKNSAVFGKYTPIYGGGLFLLYRYSCRKAINSTDGTGPEVKCEVCLGACCEEFVLPRGDARDPASAWFALHGTETGSEEKPTLTFECACTKLLEGRCSIYNSRERPIICTIYPAGALTASTLFVVVALPINTLRSETTTIL